MNTIRRAVAAPCEAIHLDRRGSVTVEYALLAATLAIATVMVLTPIGTGLAREFTAIAHTGGLDPATARPVEACHPVQWPDLDARFVTHDAAPEHSHLP